MKKLVLVLAVLLVSLPAMAAVTIDAACDGSTYTVTYTTTGNNVRAFALDIEVSAGTITAVGNLSTSYDIYPGSIVIVDGEVSDAGSAVCDASYPDTLGGIGTAGVTIEMGSLYAEGEAAPATTGVLFTFTVSDSAATVTITENGIRGGVVMEDPEEDITPTINVNQCPQGPQCNACSFDLNGDTYLGPEDVGAFVTLLSGYASNYYYIAPGEAGYDVCLDANGDTYLGPEDVGALVTFLSGYAGDYYYVLCDGASFPQ